jgi:MFS family permease
MSRELPAEETLDVVGMEIEGWVVATAMGAGVAGTALMLPILVGLPRLLGVFQTEPITEFAGVAGFVGIEPTLAVGVVLFAAAGGVALPLTFLVVGAFLPPEEPRYLRGVTFAMVFWTGFPLAFWPGGDLLTVASFLVFSLSGHLVYGLTLGLVVDRITGIPQHDV